MMYLYAHQIGHSYGKERRAKIMQWFHDNAKEGVLAINRKYQLQLHQDPDLQKLLKKGVLVRMRERRYNSKHPFGSKPTGTNQSYLVSPLYGK